MSKRYVLMVKSLSKYDNYWKCSFKLFNSYLDLQKHLAKYWFMNKYQYVVFGETNIKRDYSTNDIKRKIEIL